VEPNEIFALIIKADEKLKYTHEPGAMAARTQQARELLERARAEATAIGNSPLVEQAEQRLADLAAVAEPDVDPSAGDGR
jgi:hypothetical protein